MIAINLNSKIINPRVEGNTMQASLFNMMAPEDIGELDAELGLPCNPTEYFTKLADIEAYIISFNDTTEALENAAEYAEYFADETFFRYGGA